MRCSSTALALLAAACAVSAAAADVEAAMRGADTVHVASPTGVRDTDRASILAALEGVRPGDTVQFGAGRYLVGPIMRIDTPGITLLGHPDGTVLRGCELAKRSGGPRSDARIILVRNWARELAVRAGAVRDRR